MDEPNKNKNNTQLPGDNKPKTKYLLIFGLICSVIFLVVSFYPLIIGIFFHSSQERGFAGDMYGALNTLFSGLAFAGIIITIIMQMKELELTREELQKSAEAQQGTFSALTQQLENMKYSSQIDAIKKYIESLDTFNDEDKIIIAKSVLSDLVDNVFHSSEYIRYMRPNISKINIEPYKENIHQNYTLKSVKVSLKNYGASCYIKNIVINNSISYKIYLETYYEIIEKGVHNIVSQTNTNFERNTTLIFDFVFSSDIETPELFEVEFELVSKFVNYTWKQKLIVQHFKHNQGSVIFEDMVLVN